jgi:formylglycine-generating enzyme required for sulfatase activity
VQARTGRHPIIYASWYDALRFCNLLSDLEGLYPCYEFDLAAGNSEPAVRIVSDDGYRLPTEAEWEYACRAENSGKWCFGDDKGKLHEFAWYAENSDNRIHSVGGKKPNAWGLYDMHGNVWEWCWDWHADQYETLDAFPGIDSRGPKDGVHRVVRGGSSYFKSWNTRSAYRMGEPPDIRGDDLGFRVARSLYENY